MGNQKSIKELRSDLTCVDGKPGYYTWWFDEAGTNLLLKELPAIDKSKIQEKDGYFALYFGIANNCHERINWHINQKHRVSAVKSGYLSTLRKTLSALLGKDMTQSEEAVNQFMDAHCQWTWEYTPSRKDAEDHENKELTHKPYLYPLNIQKNKNLDKAVIQRLKELRKKHKK